MNNIGKMLKELKIKNKSIKLPIYFPDATRGVIRGVSFNELSDIGIEGTVVNTYHLMSQPGKSVLKSASKSRYSGNITTGFKIIENTDSEGKRGLKNLVNWDGLIVSDSGGFQLLSMIYQNKSYGTISDNGIVFKRGSKGKSDTYKFTPEKCIEMQFDISSDVIYALDDCPLDGNSEESIKESIRRTILWSKRSKAEYQKQIEQRRIPPEKRPLLFAVVQGGNSKKYRKECADQLKEIGFDGYGFGGWPLDNQGQFDVDIVGYTAEQMPDDKPKFALGIGNPQAIIEGYKLGYNIFDCVLPTRDGRHGKLYHVAEGITPDNILKSSKVFRTESIRDNSFVRDFSPVATLIFRQDNTENGTNKLITGTSKAFLNHLFKIEDSLGMRIASLNNLNTYVNIIELLRANSDLAS